MSNWNNLVYSTTKADYVKSLDEFELLYMDKKYAIKYIRDTWLQWKEKFVSAWTKVHLHLGNRASSRAEGSVTPCIGHYTATMGLPCAHTIKDWNEVALSLKLIHPHWSIDKMSMNREDDLQNDGDNRFVKLLEELNSKYQVWPLNKKEHAISMINQLVNESDILFEPVTQRPKGRPQKSKKNKGITSTRQDPSKFEIVESSRAHNPSSSTRVFHNNNEAADEYSYIHHDSVFDLNAVLDF
ncbi:hypothetical protein Tco_1330976 [Tanacetum coccineum]